MSPLSKFINYPEINKFILDTNSGIIRYNKCLALIGNKSKTNIVLDNIIEQIGVNNYYIFDNTVVLDEDSEDDDEIMIYRPIVNGESIFNTKLVVFKPKDTPFKKMEPHLKEYISGDQIWVYIKNNYYIPDLENIDDYENEYNGIHGAFKSNFVVELTPEDYINADGGLKRRFQAVYL